MFQVSINSIQKHLRFWVIVRKQNFNQNFNLYVDAARHTDQRQSISRNISLKNPAKNVQCEEKHYFIFLGRPQYLLFVVQVGEMQQSFGWHKKTITPQSQ